MTVLESSSQGSVNGNQPVCAQSGGHVSATSAARRMSFIPPIPPRPRLGHPQLARNHCNAPPDALPCVFAKPKEPKVERQAATRQATIWQARGDIARLVRLPAGVREG